jgi:sulfite reductase beta subunit-like hemoprotein
LIEERERMEPETKSLPTEGHLDQATDKKQEGKGRLGTLDNPEKYASVPGHIIPIVEKEFEDFESEATRFRAGETAEEEFIGFRLKQGVYGQRQPDVQMIRVKVPFGGITPEQLEAFAEVCERWAPLNKGHITTRQNIQIHHMPLEDMPDAMRVLSKAGLSSREGCGNTVRNVTGDPYAGICQGEVFDITPYAAAYVRYFVRHPTTQLMPRKIKTAFTATDEDRAITGIHDIGFIPRIRREGDREVRGVEMRVGGGTSIMPRVAPTLAEFLTVDDGEYLKWTEAALRIFDRQKWLRENRARARIKVLVDKIGIDEFREMLLAEIEGDWVEERDFSVNRLITDADEEAEAEARTDEPVGTLPTSGDPDMLDFCRSNVISQRQEGFVAVAVKIPRGDLTPEQFRALAGIIREYAGGWARTTVQQNLVLRWVRPGRVEQLWEALGEIGLGGAGAEGIRDVVSCPGTDSCKMGITSSMGLNRAISERLEEIDVSDPLTAKIRIKMSGCPNGCSQHHIADIGFYGASIKVGDRTIPAYVPHIGGRQADGVVGFGVRLKSRLPAKRVPAAIARWIDLYETERLEGEEFANFAERVGTEPFEAGIRDLAMPDRYSEETIELFTDWSRKEEFKVERGEGECAV